MTASATSAATITSTTSQTNSKSIAVIIGSTRKLRAGPQITDFVVQKIQQSQAFASLGPGYTLSTIDLTSWNLPILDETQIPSQVHVSSGYGQPHTQRWSEEILRHVGFIFVTPQYNWGYPAGLKNAIDYLFYEWKGKPAMIVTYGGHGGGKCAAQLRYVLEGGIGMRVCKTMPELSFVGREMLKAAAYGENLGLGLVDEEGEERTGGFKEVWDGYTDVIATSFGELVELINEQPKV